MRCFFSLILVGLHDLTEKMVAFLQVLPRNKLGEAVGKVLLPRAVDRGFSSFRQLLPKRNLSSMSRAR